MADQQLRDLAATAERHVRLPDFDTLARRGARRRTGRRVAAAGVAAALAVTGYLTATQTRPAADGPVDRPGVPEVTWYPGGASWPELEAGTYQLALDRETRPLTALVTVPPGWRGWFGPNRPVGTDGYVGLLLVTVTGVVQRPCEVGTQGMRPVGDDAGELVAALTRMPRHRVTVAPEPDDRFGFPGTHLRVRSTAAARCPGRAEFELWNTTSALIQSAGPGSVLDLWVVDVDGTPVLVSATRKPGTPQWAVRQLDDVVDSVVLLPAEDAESHR